MDKNMLDEDKKQKIENEVGDEVRRIDCRYLQNPASLNQKIP